jgi:hypothetical protein
MPLPLPMSVGPRSVVIHLTCPRLCCHTEWQTRSLIRGAPCNADNTIAPRTPPPAWPLPSSPPLRPRVRSQRARLAVAGVFLPGPSVVSCHRISPMSTGPCTDGSRPGAVREPRVTSLGAC